MGKICKPFCGELGTWTFEFFWYGAWIEDSIKGGSEEVFTQTTIPSPSCLARFGIPTDNAIIGSCFPENVYPIHCSNLTLQVRNFRFTPTGGLTEAKDCYCSDDSCRVDCPASPDGFCCIDHSVTDRLLKVISGDSVD